MILIAAVFCIGILDIVIGIYTSNTLFASMGIACLFISLIAYCFQIRE